MSDQEAPRQVRTRDEIRAKILATRPPEKRIVKFFGEDIEIRQPLLGDVLRSSDNTDREAVVIDTLIKYAYIPGTNERVFEETDAEVFKTMPFGPDFLEVNRALEAMLTLDPKQQPSA